MKPINVSIEAIDALLPQTQCGDCSYPGCLPYATAIQQGEAPLNACLPGGVSVLKNLGLLLQTDVSPLLDEMVKKAKPKRLAVIREAECIGCTKCIQACPVDAIFGASKQMHTVITDECTGCNLCVAPCPVDCIDMIETTDQSYRPDHARARFQQRSTRLAKQQQQTVQHFQENILTTATDATTKKAAIAEAIARSARKKLI